MLLLLNVIVIYTVILLFIVIVLISDFITSISFTTMVMLLKDLEHYKNVRLSKSQ